MKKIINIIFAIFLAISLPATAQNNQTENNQPNEEQILSEMQNIFNEIAKQNKQNNQTEQNNQNDETFFASIVNRVINLIPADNPMREWAKELFGLKDVITNSAGKYDALTINNTQSNIRINNKNFQLPKSEEEEFINEFGGMAAKLKAGNLSPEEGFAMIDGLLNKIPENSYARNILSEYVNAFKYSNKRLENIDAEVYNQSK